MIMTSKSQTFIDWVIAVPARITRSVSQIEIKMYCLSRELGNAIFTNPIGKSLISLSKRFKNKERKEIWIK